jgi:chromosome segregation ATPase
MTEKDLIREYKNTIADLIKEKDDINLLVKEKDGKIKKILVQLEQANDDVQAMGKKIGELESKLKKKSEIKKNLSKKIDEILSEESEKKVDTSVDMDE